MRVSRDVWVFHIPSRTSHAQSTRRSRPMCSTNCRVRRKLAWQLPAESALAFPPVASPSACPLPRTASGKPVRQSRAEGPRAGRGPCDTPEQGRAFPALHAAARPFAVGRRRERISLRTGTKLQTLSGPDDSTRSRGSQLPTRTTGRITAPPAPRDHGPGEERVSTKTPDVTSLSARTGALRGAGTRPPVDTDVGDSAYFSDDREIDSEAGQVLHAS